MNWLRRLFGTESHKTPTCALNDLADALSRSLVAMTIPQLQMLGFEAGTVPPEGDFFSKRSRGYLLGTVAAVVYELKATDYGPIVSEAIKSTFSMVYGPIHGNTAYVQTLREIAGRDPETLAASDRAEKDVKAVYVGEPHAAVVGFWLLNNGIRGQADVIPALPTSGAPQ